MSKKRLAVYLTLGYIAHAIVVFGFAILSMVNIRYSIVESIDDAGMIDNIYSIANGAMLTSLVSSFVVFVALWFFISKKLK